MEFPFLLQIEGSKNGNFGYIASVLIGVSLGLSARWKYLTVPVLVYLSG